MVSKNKIKDDLAIVINRNDDLISLCDTAINTFQQIKTIVRGDKKRLERVYKYLLEKDEKILSKEE